MNLKTVLPEQTGPALLAYLQEQGNNMGIARRLLRFSTLNTGFPAFEEPTTSLTLSANSWEDDCLDALTQTVIKEDRRFLSQLRSDVPHANRVTLTDLTPASVAKAREIITCGDVPVSDMLFSNAVWDSIVVDPDWHQIIDPITRIELFTQGRLGTILGMNMLSDIYRHPLHRVVKGGELFLFPPPQNLGTLHVRVSDITQTTAYGKLTWAWDHLIDMQVNADEVVIITLVPKG
jgi:hypothetical protein